MSWLLCAGWACGKWAAEIAPCDAARHLPMQLSSDWFFSTKSSSTPRTVVALLSGNIRRMRCCCRCSDVSKSLRMRTRLGTCSFQESGRPNRDSSRCPSPNLSRPCVILIRAVLPIRSSLGSARRRKQRLVRSERLCRKMKCGGLAPTFCTMKLTPSGQDGLSSPKAPLSFTITHRDSRNHLRKDQTR